MKINEIRVQELRELVMSKDLPQKGGNRKAGEWYPIKGGRGEGKG